MIHDHIPAENSLAQISHADLEKARTDGRGHDGLGQLAEVQLQHRRQHMHVLPSAWGSISIKTIESA